ALVHPRGQGLVDVVHAAERMAVGGLDGGEGAPLLHHQPGRLRGRAVGVALRRRGAATRSHEDDEEDRDAHGSSRRRHGQNAKLEVVPKTRVLVLGAGGQIARWGLQMLASKRGRELTLYLRDAKKLGRKRPKDARVVEADVLDEAQLGRAMVGQDVVYANLAGDVDRHAARIVAAMRAARVKRLIFVLTVGVYDEAP